MKATSFVLIGLGGCALGVPTAKIDRTKQLPPRAIPSDIPGLGDLGDLFGLGGSGSGDSGGLGGLLDHLGHIPGLGGSGSGGLGGLGGSGSGGLGDLGGSGSSGLGGLGGSGSSGLSGLMGGMGKSAVPSGSGSEGSDSGGLGGLLSSFGGGSANENGVTDNEGCNPLTFIFARGTMETGNMGTVVGPPVAEALRSALNDKVTIQGVDYPASAAGNVAMGAAGGPKMEKLAQQAVSQCPDTKVALGGYSQGAMVVHNAAKSFDNVAAAVVFGDPLKTMQIGSLPENKAKVFCATGDPVCANGANFMAHLSYGSNTEDAANFIIQAAGVQ